MKPSSIITICLTPFLFASCTKWKNPNPSDLDRGLYAYYPFSGDADDASGNGFHAEAMNGAALTTDRFGTNNSAYYFDGDNDFLKSPLKDMSYSDEASVTAIIQPDEITKNTYYNITRQGPHPANFLLAFQDRGKILSFGMFTGGSYKELDVKIDPADFVDGNWHCVAGVYDGAHMKLFVDGVLLGQTEKTGKVEKPGGAYNPIGSMIGRERFKGKIDEVRFYDRGLLNKEVGSLCDILHNNTPYQLSASGLSRWETLPNTYSKTALYSTCGGHNPAFF